MKRLAALLLCLLLLGAPAALAVQGEASPEESSPEQTLQEGEEPAEGENAPEAEAPEEENEEQPEAPQEKPQEEPSKPAGPDLTALSSETAIHNLAVNVTVDDSGRAYVTQNVEIVVVGDCEKLRFSFPEGAKKADIAGHWDKSQKEHGLRYLSVSNRKGFQGTQTFTMTYTMKNLVKGGEESQILTLPLLSLQDYPIGDFTITVTMPKAFSTKPQFSSGYYSSYVEDVMTVTSDGTVITGTMNQITRDNDSLEMKLVLPEGYFAGNYTESFLSTFLTTVVLILCGGVLIYWLRTMRNTGLRVHSRTLPPDGVNPGDIPFLLAGGHADFNMLVSHWAVLGYLSFYVNKNGNVVLYRRMSMGNERRPFEQKLFDLLFGQGEICDGASMRYKTVGERAMEAIPRYWSRRLYERRSGSPVVAKLLCALACALALVAGMDALAPAKLHGLYLCLSFVAGGAMGWMIPHAFGAYYLGQWLFTALGALCGLVLLIVAGVGEATLAMLPAVALSCLMGWQTVHGGKRKPYGDEVIAQTLGFRRFLKAATDQNAMQMFRRDSQYFYKILPYAEAMGLGRKFVTLFHDCKLEPCQWFESARSTPTTAAGFYDQYVDALDMLNIGLKK